ncbi:MAG: HPr family phosphocarrier protein [Candidatus Omnitrophica bacterium]|nr:HPr family phosphocarrier protein [Candidatus Omnitrophota bacterium]
MVEKDFEIQNELGLHARPAALFVKTANGFKADIIVEKEGKKVNGKSIMGIMMLAAAKGSAIKIKARGKDADEAMGALQQLILSKFGEE